MEIKILGAGCPNCKRLEKLARQEEKERLREARQHLKEQGVPWYRRLFYRH